MKKDLLDKALLFLEAPDSWSRIQRLSGRLQRLDLLFLPATKLGLSPNGPFLGELQAATPNQVSALS